MAAVAALVGAVIGKLLGVGRAEAGHTGSDLSIFHLNATNQGFTILEYNIAGPAFRARNVHPGGPGGVGIIGTSVALTGVVGVNGGAIHPTPPAGVLGAAPGNRAGVVGLSGTASIPEGSAAGVTGVAPDGATGVRGFGGSPGPPPAGPTAGVGGTSSSGVGVSGTSTTNIGVYGLSASGPGVYGQSTNNAGIYGFSSANIGVRGESQNSVGVYGTSANNYAFYGQSTGGVGFYGSSTGNIGVYAQATTGTALYAISNSGPAAQFFGSVFVTGNHTVTGTKSAAVPHPDGSHRRLYCEESTESWFSDYGEGRLVNGRAVVRLDADFDAVVRGDRYHVFFTEEGDYGGMYLADKRPHVFEVRARSATASGPFSYRVVAKRRDIAGPRLEKVDLPPRGTLPSPPPPPVHVPLEQVEPADRGRPAR
jgi:hypothetical protein